MRLDASQKAALAQGKHDLMRAFGTGPDLTALAYGFRTRHGEVTDEPVVIASVEKKRPEAYLSGARLLPRTVTVNGRRWGVDVVQAGRFTLAAPLARRRARDGGDAEIGVRHRPVIQGAALANLSTKNVATLGCVVRDRTSGGAPALLTSGHGIGSLNGARPGDSIVQPAEDPLDFSDRIGTLDRFTTLRKDRRNTVDAAVIRLDTNTAVERWAAGNMAPVGITHPLLGLHIANGTDGSGLCARMTSVFAALDLESYHDLSGGEFPVVCDEVDFNTHVDKAGVSGYTSNRVAAWGVTPVNLGTEQAVDFYLFDDLVQIGPRFTGPYDVGAAVCRGGDGQTYLEEDISGIGCAMMSALGGLYDLPVSGDEELADTFRDDFLLQSRVGRMLVRLFYVNYQKVVDRIEAADATADEKDAAAQLYGKYRDFAEQVLTTPDDPTRVVTDEHLLDATYIRAGLERHMSPEEDRLSRTLLAMFQRTEGMNRAQILTMMNGDPLYQEVHAALAAVPSIEHLGPLGADD